MGKMTEYFDYLKKDPNDLTRRYIAFNYFHIDIGENEKAVRRDLKLYNDPP